MEFYRTLPIALELVTENVTNLSKCQHVKSRRAMRRNLIDQKKEMKLGIRTLLNAIVSFFVTKSGETSY